MTSITLKKSPIERILGAFAEIHAGEGTKTLLLTFNIFLILTSYLIAKVVREPLILAGGGAEIKTYSSAIQVILLAGAMRLYSWLVAKYPRRFLINSVTLFFVGCLVMFRVLSSWDVPLGVAFFLWVGIFSLVVIAQFWSFANDIHTTAQGKRLFAIIAFGASAGGVFGPMISSLMLKHLNVYDLLLVSAGILAVSLLITNYVDTKERALPTVAPAGGTPALSPEDKISRSGAFKVVWANRYLLMIAFLILFTNWVNTTGEYIVSRVVTAKAAQLAGSDPTFSENTFIGGFYADYFTVVGFVGLVMQMFFVSRILKYLGVRFAIMMLPMIAFGGYFIIALIPSMLAVIRWAKTAENATDYSLNNTVRHVLFLPTTKEEKYKAKVTIDSFFQRAGDVLSAALVYIGVTWLSFSVSQFAMTAIGLIIIWLILAFAIGKENRRLAAARDAVAA